MSVTALLDLTLTLTAVAAESETRALISSVLEATRAFDGCLGCDVLVDAEDPAHVVVHERWQSLSHDDAYRAWRQTPAGASKLAEVLAAPPRLSRFTTAEGV